MSAICALVTTVIDRSAPRVIWNISESAPIGLYGVDPDAHIARDDMVIARLPAGWRAFAARRNYLPSNVPLVKRVAAVAGDDVCAYERILFVNGKRRASRRMRDGAGRTMPWWTGCLTVPSRSFLLLMPAAGSFDGRYFGLVGDVDLVGRATPIWTR